jgi:single-stranded DNA-binding protein
MIIVEGRLNTRSWETEDGERKYATEVNVSKVTVTGKGSASEEAPKAKKAEVEKSTSIDQMPF